MGVPRELFSEYDALISFPQFETAFAQFHKNAESFWNMTDSPQSYAESDYIIGFGFGFSEANKKAKKWKALIPTEGAIAWRDHLLVTRRVQDSALRETLAMEFINEALSKEYQLEVNLRANSAQAMRSDAYEMLTPSEKTSLSYLQDLQNFKGTKVLLPSLSKRSRNGFERLYRKYSQKPSKD
jgi:spermidine/putrescine-binding protein